MLLLILGVQLVAVGLEAELSARIYHAVKGWKIYAIREICSTRRDEIDVDDEREGRTKKYLMSAE
jgi:hypothetical protein